MPFNPSKLIELQPTYNLKRFPTHLFSKASFSKEKIFLLQLKLSVKNTSINYRNFL
jgi:hypothetical protein